MNPQNIFGQLFQGGKSPRPVFELDDDGLGRPLPTLPLWLREGPCLRADLGATYEQTCREYRITTNGA